MEIKKQIAQLRFLSLALEKETKPLTPKGIRAKKYEEYNQHYFFVIDQLNKMKQSNRMAIDIIINLLSIPFIQNRIQYNKGEMF